jgi:type I restriction enzyme S subunit
VSELPKGWSNCKLEDCVKILDSLRKPINNRERQVRVEGKSADELFPYYGATGKVGYIDDYLFDGEFVALGEDGVPFFDILKKKAYMLEGKTWVNNHAHVIKGADGVNNRYLYYYLNQVDYHGYVNGATRLKLTQANMRKLPVKLAPLNEQIRIADKLDSMLAKVDAAQARLDKIPNILKRFRQSVLTAATSGELTKEWRGKKDIKEDWEQCKFSELLLNIRSGSGLKPNDTAGIPILRSSAVRNLVIDYTDYRLLNEDEKIKIDDYLEKDDLMFTRLSGSPEYVGNCARVDAIKEHSIQYPDRLFRAKLKHPELSHFLELYFCAPKFRGYIGANLSSSAGHQRITIGVLKKVNVVIPSIEEQKEIVRRVGYLFALADTTEKQYLSAKAKTNRLTQSILAKAFRGELVAQDSNDESAELLLRKIQQVYKTDVKSKKKK